MHRKRGTAVIGDKVAVPGSGEEVWYKLESSGTGYSDGERSHVERKPAIVRENNGEAVGWTAQGGTTAGDLNN